MSKKVPKELLTDRKKGLTLDERREMIKALFKSRNQPVEEFVEEQVAPVEEQLDEEEEAEREHVKRKQRYKKKQEGRLRPRGRR